MNNDLKDKYYNIKQEIGLYGSSPEIEDIIRLVTTVAPSDLSVLIAGESGTGKELVARAIHHLSHRATQPLIAVNTGAIPEGILESELFGHEKGSFTGAISQKKGYFEAANHGTIFLDEIGEMSLNTQVKLLRVIEESEFIRVGGTETHKIDVRIIAATNKDLEIAVNNNEFRRDLYYRLKAINIIIPPLRKRKEDIQVLAQKFASDYAEAEGINFKGFSPEALEIMKEYDWPGNVRELRNFVETALILNKGEVVHSSYVSNNLAIYKDTSTSRNLPIHLKIDPDQAERELIYRTLLALKIDINEIKQILLDISGNSHNIVSNHYPEKHEETVTRGNGHALQPSTLAAMEREMIKQTLNKFAGSRRKTARALQISERTLYRKIKDYGL